VWSGVDGGVAAEEGILSLFSSDQPSFSLSSFLAGEKNYILLLTCSIFRKRTGCTYSKLLYISFALVAIFQGFSLFNLNPTH
jgi:hypothetical protein